VLETPAQAKAAEGTAAHVTEAVKGVYTHLYPHHGHEDDDDDDDGDEEQEEEEEEECDDNDDPSWPLDRTGVLETPAQAKAAEGTAAYVTEAVKGVYTHLYPPDKVRPPPQG
jgi:hypothetical protein